MVGESSTRRSSLCEAEPWPLATKTYRLRVDGHAANARRTALHLADAALAHLQQGTAYYSRIMVHNRAVTMFGGYIQ